MEDGPLVDAIYEAALVPENWPSVLDAIAAELGSVGGLLFAGDGGGWQCSAPIQEPFQRIVEAGWLGRNSRLSRALAAGLASRVVTDLDIFTVEEMDADPLYQALRPIGWRWFAGCAVSLPGSHRAVFSFERSFAAGAYDRGTVQKLERLRPHLARATLLSARIRLDRHATMAETLARVGLPAAVLGSGGRLLASNVLFEAATPSSVVVGCDRIHLTDLEADRLFVDALRGLGFGFAAAAPLSLALRARGGAPARLFHLLPIRHAAHDLYPGAVCLIVMAAASGRGPPDPDLIGALFQLSPRETALAMALSGGDTLTGYAAQAGISANTARSQLKRIFEKTGVRRQAELISLLVGLSGSALPSGVRHP